MGVDRELRKIISTPFKRKSEDQISEKSFIFSLALDLNWFSLNEAKNVVEVAKSKKLIKEEKDGLVPNFSLDEVDTSLSFQPNNSFLDKIENKSESFLDKVIEKIQSEKDVNKQKIISKANNIQDELNKYVDIEVAALLLCYEMGLESLDLINEKINQL